MRYSAADAESCVCRQVNKYLFRAGHKVDRMYMVMSGGVALLRGSQERERFTQVNAPNYAVSSNSACDAGRHFWCESLGEFEDAPG